MSFGWIALLVIVGIPSIAVLVAASAFFAPFVGLLVVIALSAGLFDELRKQGGRARRRIG